MTIGIDIDDTITNSSEIFIEYAKKYNIENNIKHKIDNTTLNANRSFGWNKNELLRFKKQYLQLVLENVIVKDNSVEIINNLKKNNKIIFITSRNVTELPNMKEITVNWLQKQGFKYDDLIMNCENKKDACLLNKVDIFIDNSLTQCLNVSSLKNCLVLLFKTKYNLKDDNDFEKVNGWLEIDYRIKRYINEKK